MSNIIGTNRTSVCMYCGQAAYGKNCPYSPSKTHVHIDDPKRCIYCGQLSYGNNCPYNPFGKNHIHGVEFNLMMKESIERGFTASVILERLSKPIVETSAYKLGLIDSNGDIIKLAESKEEKAALTPIDLYILKLRKIIGETKLQLINTSILIEKLNHIEESKFNSSDYEKEVDIQSDIVNLVEDYKNILLKAFEQNISFEIVENMLYEEIVSKNCID